MNDAVGPRDFFLIFQAMPREQRDVDPSTPARETERPTLIVADSEWTSILELVERADPGLAAQLGALIPPLSVEVRPYDALAPGVTGALRDFLLRPHELPALFATDNLHPGHFVAYFAVETVLKKLLAVCARISEEHLDYRAGPLL